MNLCTKRHPKLCKNYSKSGKCRFNGDCKYSHEESKKSIKQDEINQSIANIMSKHEQEINILKEEMNQLKSENVKIYDQIQATVNTVKEAEFMNENTEQSVLKIENIIKSLKNHVTSNN